ncbi:MAG: PD40 domain-containing protein [Anaerolineae bacterium]|nr:PD40 domain-containing protein [Anaerolineae bacterium]
MTFTAAATDTPIPTVVPSYTPAPTPSPSPVPTALPLEGLPEGVISFLGPGDQLWLMLPNGQDQEQLTSGGPVLSPVWSPNGEKLAYIQKGESGRHEAMLYEVAAKRSYTVTTGIADAGFYQALFQLSWSSTGRYLLLDSGTDRQSRLVIVDVTTGQIKDIITTVYDNGSSYGWSPVGEQLAYIQGVELEPREAVLYDLATGFRCTPTAAISEDWISETLGGITSDWFHETLIILNWSPDGRYLLLDSGTSPERCVVILEAATGRIENGLIARGYAWSPDGRRLAFGQAHPLETPIPIGSGDSIDIAVLEIGQPTPRVVLEGSSEVGYYPRSWLPDGRLLYTRLNWNETATDHYTSEWTLLIDGGNAEPQPAEDLPPDLNPDVRAGLPIAYQGLANASHFSWSSDRRWLVFQAGDPMNASIYLFQWQSNTPPYRLARGTDPAWQPRPRSP